MKLAVVYADHIQPKSYKHFGHVVSQSRTDGDYNAVIEPGKTILIRGRYGTGDRVEYFQQRFSIGDYAEYHSYNLIYTGKIVRIGPKTVTIDDCGQVHRLDLYTFIDKNWDYDAKRIADANHDTMQYI